MRVTRKSHTHIWDGERFLPPTVYTVRTVTAPLGEEIEHAEYGTLHAQQGCLVLTSEDGEEIVSHPDDLVEHFEEIVGEPQPPAIEITEPVTYLP